MESHFGLKEPILFLCSESIQYTSARYSNTGMAYLLTLRSAMFASNGNARMPPSLLSLPHVEEEEQASSPMGCVR